MMRWRRAFLRTLLLTLATLSVSATSAKRVLLLHSFGRDFAPFNTFSGTFCTELVSQLPESVDVFEISVESSRFGGSVLEGPLLDYLAAVCSESQLDLVVPIGGPAVQYAQRHRQELFPGTPMLITAVDQRLLEDTVLTTNDTAVAVRNEPARIVQTILELLPKTTNIAVVIGTSPLERFWLNETRDAFQRFTNQVHFVWLNELSFEEMLKHCAVLPPRSAVFYPVLARDAEGVPYQEEQTLARLHEVANAPLFGIHDTQLGRGIVGGPLMAIEDLGRNSARVAQRILRGERPGDIRIPPQEPGTPKFDWRELRRWGIPKTRLPAGSSVLFRQPSVWELYWGRIIAGIGLCLGEGVLIILLVVNLRNRLRAERSLRQSQEHFQLLMEQAPEAILVYDSVQDRVLQANSQAERLFGCDRQELLASGPRRFYDQEQPDGRPIAETFRAYTERALGGEIVMFERRICNALGRQFHCEVRLARLPGGKGKLIRASFIDVTERKRTAAKMLEQRIQLAHIARVSTMGELATAMAHELNQPLAAILANAEAAELFLEREPPAIDELGDILAAIRKDDERAAEVIRRMRALLRKQEMERQPVEINSLVEDVCKLVRGDAALRGMSLTADLGPALPRVSGDRVHLQQVMLNLILNGIDAMAELPRERRRILVCSRLAAEGQVELAVIDAGHGIEPNKLPRLFEPFYTTKPNGMGMGLCIARTIIEAHQGRIWAENVPSGGAVFRIVLPANDKGQMAPEDSASSAPPPSDVHPNE